MIAFIYRHESTTLIRNTNCLHLISNLLSQFLVLTTLQDVLKKKKKLITVQIYCSPVTLEAYNILI